MASNEVVRALAVTAELCGANLSEGAAKIIVLELEHENEADVLKALERMRREHEGRFTLAAILKFANDAKRDRISSQELCYICGAPAKHRGPVCDEHLEHEKTVAEPRRLAAFMPKIERHS